MGGVAWTTLTERMAWEAERRKVERLDHQSFKSRERYQKFPREKGERERNESMYILYIEIGRRKSKDTFILIGQYRQRVRTVAPALPVSLEMPSE